MGAPFEQAFWRQLYLIGVQSAGIVMLLAALAGGGFVLSLLPDGRVTLSLRRTLQTLMRGLQGWLEPAPTPTMAPKP